MCAPTWHVPPRSPAHSLTAYTLHTQHNRVRSLLPLWVASRAGAVPIWLINRPTRPPPPTTCSRTHSLTAAHRPQLATREAERGKGVGSHGRPLLPLRRGGGGARAPVPRRRRALPRGPARRGRRRRRRRRGELQRQRRRRVLGPLAEGPRHLVRPAQRRRPRRQRWCVRLQAHQPVPVHVHGLLRQPAIVQGRQGVRLLLQDSVHQGQVLLRQGGDGDHHRHELLPGVQVPLRPQRHGVRQARQARPQRQAPPLGHHRHRVHQGAVRVPGPEDRVPRGGVLEPRVPGAAGGVRGRRRRRGAGGPDGVQDGPRPADGAVDADARVLGFHLAPRQQPPHAGALLRPHPQRVRQDAHRPERHPGQLEAQHILPLLRPVQLVAHLSFRRQEAPSCSTTYTTVDYYYY